MSFARAGNLLVDCPVEQTADIAQQIVRVVNFAAVFVLLDNVADFQSRDFCYRSAAPASIIG